MFIVPVGSPKQMASVCSTDIEQTWPDIMAQARNQRHSDKTSLMVTDAQ
jgi:hypothetical protein